MSEVYFEPEDVDLCSDRESLTIYRWNDRDVNHYFCKVCGVYPFHDTIYEPGKYRINLGCLEGVDPRALSIRFFDGRNLL